MRKVKFFVPFLAVLLSAIACTSPKDKALVKAILSDERLDRVDSLAAAIVSTGFTAGDGYGEVWIRDFNTFIDLALEVTPDSVVRRNLLTFFDFQGEDGNIPDGFIDKSKTRDITGFGPEYQYRYSQSDSLHAAHKNTVETDQESSLIQAVCRYASITGDESIFDEIVCGQSVRDRLLDAVQWLLYDRFEPEYGLLWGATTADWGDVQPEHSWGVMLTADSHRTIDIYDNAMFGIALENLACFCPDDEADRLLAVRDSICDNVRKYLWDSEKCKFRPHIYLDGSPFPEDFDEDAIYYNGGTAVAIQAGFLTAEEVAAVNAKLLENVDAAGAQSVGLTLYPCYPGDFFLNPIMASWHYQNGGDWTWFGARMIQALCDYGYIAEAYEEIQPMLDRVLKNKGFFEWYTVSGEPRGSGTYRGSAGELYKAIRALRTWALN